MSEEYRGAMGGLASDEMETFLGSDALARLAVLRPDGAPYVVPIWYQWHDGAFWFVGRERSEWCRYIEADGRVSVVIDKEHGKPDEDSGSVAQIPKIIASGTAEVVERPNVGGQWVAIAADMARRYLGENGPSYLESTLLQPRWLIRLVPDEVKTWKGVGWAKRYWVDSKDGPSFEQAHGIDR